MNLDQMFPSKYLKSGEVEGDADMVLTMSHVASESLKTKSGGDEVKPVLHFTDSDKGMVLNRTNATTIAKLYGDDTGQWSGQKIALFAAVVDAFGEMTTALRVRPVNPANAKRPRPPQAPAPAAQYERLDLGLYSGENLTGLATWLQANEPENPQLADVYAKQDREAAAQPKPPTPLRTAATRAKPATVVPDSDEQDDTDPFQDE